MTIDIYEEPIGRAQVILVHFDSELRSGIYLFLILMLTSSPLLILTYLCADGELEPKDYRFLLYISSSHVPQTLPFYSFIMFVLRNIFLASVFLVATVLALKREDCEVCFGVLEKFSSSLSDESRSDHKQIEEEFKTFCRNSKNRENRFCYYLGGLEESATGILSELSKPLTYSLPIEKICEKLKKKDAQICDLRYEKTIDFKTVDLKKLKVKDLKNILNNWDETCDGCIEKSDFIKRIEELKPKYVRDEL